MKFLVIRNYNIFILLLVLLLLVSSCARRGRPEGGPKDISPPVLLKAKPDTFATNVSANLKKIELEFDELVVLKDYIKNVIISPPIEPPPMFSPVGTASYKVEVSFEEALRDSTTYTINFGKSIQDNNEGNPYQYFTYVFSTGDFIDSLSVKGSVKTLGKRKQEENIIAALYKFDKNYKDSLIYTEKPYYIAKVDSIGNFELKNLHEGQYKLIAFNDKIANLKFDSKTEKIAFADSIITAGEEKSFKLNISKVEQDYKYVNAEQKSYGRIDFYFEGNPEKLEIKSLENKIKKPYIIHHAYSDTLQYYFNPEEEGLGEKRERLRFTVNHLGKIDSIPPVLFDTSKKADFKISIAGGDLTPETDFNLKTNFPIDNIDKDYIFVSSDSIDLDFEIKQKNEHGFGLKFPVDFDRTYTMKFLPKAVKDIFGNVNDTLNTTVITRNIKDYGNLKLKLSNPPQKPYWIKLMDNNDNEVKSIYGNDIEFNFRFIKPGKYYIKLILDENKNKKWDAGNFFENRQAEPILIYPKDIDVKAYWDYEEVWEFPNKP